MKRTTREENAQLQIKGAVILFSVKKLQCLKVAHKINLRIISSKQKSVV